MTRSSRAKWAALLSVAALAVASTTIGVTQGAFAGQTSNGGNIITAMPDFRGPTVSAAVIGKNSGFATGFIRSGATYRVYANVTDVGTPPSGTTSVTANVSAITAGQTAAAMTAGSYTAGGVSYNYRSAVLTAAALANGPKSFSITATDAAANVTTSPGHVVTIDSTAPAPTDISASGGALGTPEVGDVLTLTASEPLDTFRLLANWNGSATTVQVRILDNNPDTLEIRDVSGATVLPFGTIDLGRNQFAGATVTFSAATMTLSGNAITVVLGGTVTGTPGTSHAAGTMEWTPSATATDRAGNAMPTAIFSEPGANDRDF